MAAELECNIEQELPDCILAKKGSEDGNWCLMNIYSPRYVWNQLGVGFAVKVAGLRSQGPEFEPLSGR